MPMKSYSRRRVLRGLLATGGAVAIPLPIFDCLLNNNGNAFAATGMPLPRRFVSWFFGNGILPPRWVPTATGNTWDLSEQLAPLVNVKDYLTVISGLARKVGGGAHPGGAAGAVTGSQEGSCPETVDRSNCRRRLGGQHPIQVAGSGSDQRDPQRDAPYASQCLVPRTQPGPVPRIRSEGRVHAHLFHVIGGDDGASRGGRYRRGDGERRCLAEAAGRETQRV